MLDIGYCFAVSQQQPCHRIGFTAKQWTIPNIQLTMCSYTDEQLTMRRSRINQPDTPGAEGNLMSETNSSRRKFIAQTGAGAASLTFTAASWDNLLRANDPVRLAVI